VAHHKSAIKRIRRNGRANVQNHQYLSSVKTAIKKFRTAVANAHEGTFDKTALTPLFISAQSMLAKAANKGVLHKNNALRRIGRLSALLKNIEAGKPAITNELSKAKKASAKKKVTNEATAAAATTAPVAAKKAAPKAKTKPASKK
jgi:small subunit ribosomal protein S20